MLVASLPGIVLGFSQSDCAACQVGLHKKAESEFWPFG